MARGIFLSYRREDSGGHTGRLYDRLVQRLGEDRVFLDIDNIPPGVDFVEAIDKTLDDCRVVVVMIGPRWLVAEATGGGRRVDRDNDFHRLEIERALDRKRRIVPVLVGGANMPQQADLPEAIRPLARKNAFELTDKRFNHDAGTLVDVLRTVLEEEERRHANLLREQQKQQHQEEARVGTGEDVFDRSRPDQRALIQNAAWYASGVTILVAVVVGLGAAQLFGQTSPTGEPVRPPSSSALSNFLAPVPDRCKGSYEPEKCVALERAMAAESPEAAARRRADLEASRAANMKQVR